MKDIPTSFASSPHQDPHKYFQNLCIEFEKLLHESKDCDQLEFEMARLINASKDMIWSHKASETYRKEDGEKACKKVWYEFSRYVAALKNSSTNTNCQDILDSIDELKRLLKKNEIR